MKNVGRALQFFRPDLPRILAVLLLSVFSIAANVLKPWPIALLLDSVLQNKKFPPWLLHWSGDQWSRIRWVLTLTLALFAIHAIQGFLSAAQNFVAIQVGLRGLRRVRSRVFATLQRLSLRRQIGRAH